MYSVILATMLTTGSTAPAWHHGGHGCHGCHGCHGGCHGCSGGCGGCSGCYGGGCYGGGCGGGGCYGGGWGTGYGGYGHHAYYGCSGGYNVFGCGGGYGGASAPAIAGYGVDRGYSPGPMMAPAPAPVAPPPAAAPAARIPFVEPIIPVADARPEVVAPAPTTTRITVRLPENARLYVNEDPCPLKSETRAFDTPQLKSDKEYSYTLRAEIVRNGQTVSEVKKVVFRAGSPVNVEFKEIGAVRTVQR